MMIDEEEDECEDDLDDLEDDLDDMEDEDEDDDDDDDESIHHDSAARRKKSTAVAHHRVKRRNKKQTSRKLWSKSVSTYSSDPNFFIEANLCGEIACLSFSQLNYVGLLFWVVLVRNQIIS